jgi:hypothetical protein
MRTRLGQFLLSDASFRERRPLRANLPGVGAFEGTLIAFRFWKKDLTEFVSNNDEYTVGEHRAKDNQKWVHGIGVLMPMR